MDKFLDQNIDEALAEYLFKKVSEYKSALDKKYTAKEKAVYKKFENKMKKVFEFASKQTDKQVSEAKKAFSARMVRKLEEKNSRIIAEQEKVQKIKEQLTEKVNKFLAGSKDRGGRWQHVWESYSRSWYGRLRALLKKRT